MTSAPECPLCMEPLEIDDINFYPCTCGYQVCTFCWHRIRTNENGLCPACRKLYPENPAEYIPLTAEQVQKSKDSRKQRSQKKKGQTVENRKYLEGVRVIQLNLVFITGLPPRVADSDVLKYCGKFGKIRNIIVNSTEYQGSQGPSLSAHVTYARKEDAAKAIKAINDIFIDGRHLKVLFGTSKYCFNFLKCQPCFKHDCTFLHELGDDEASFTNEEMKIGKHAAFEAMALAHLAGSDKPRELTRKPALQSNARKMKREAVVETKPDEMTSNVKAKRKSPHAEEPTETHENPLMGHVAQQSVWQEGASEEEEEEKLLREAMNSAIFDTRVDLPEALWKKSDTEESSASSKEPGSVRIGRPLGENWAPSIQSEWPLVDEETTNEDDLEFEIASRQLKQIMNEGLREVAQQLDSDAEKSANEALSPDGQDPETTDSLNWLQEKRSETEEENSVNADGNWRKGLLPNVNINFTNSVRRQHVAALTSVNSDVFVTQSSPMPQGLLLQGPPSSPPPPFPPPASCSVPLGAIPGLPAQQYVWTESTSTQPSYVRPAEVQAFLAYTNPQNDAPPLPPPLPLPPRMPMGYGPPLFLAPVFCLPPPVPFSVYLVDRRSPGFRGPPGIAIGRVPQRAPPPASNRRRTFGGQK